MLKSVSQIILAPSQIDSRSSNVYWSAMDYKKKAVIIVFWTLKGCIDKRHNARGSIYS